MKRINAWRGQAPRGIKTGNTTGIGFGGIVWRVPTIFMVLLLGAMLIACQEAGTSGGSNSGSNSKPTPKLATTTKTNVITATWPASEGANGYIVKVTNDQGAEVLRREVASETNKQEYTLNIDLSKEGTYTVTIYTQEKPGVEIATSNPIFISTEAIMTPTFETTTENVITAKWQARAEASAYIVKVTDNKGAEVFSTTVASETNKQEYTLEIKLPKGTYTVTVYTKKKPDEAIATSNAIEISTETIVAVYKTHNSAHRTKFSLGDYNDPELFRIGGLKDGSKPHYEIKVIEGSTPIYTLAKTQIKEAVSLSGSIYVGLAMDGATWRKLTDGSDVTITLTVYDDAGTMELFTKTIKAKKSLDGSIYSWRGLQNMQDDLSEDYTLEDNIEFPEPNTKGFVKFTPIGSEATPFTSSLDGNNKKVSKLYIIKHGADYEGLFGYVKAKTKTTVVVKDLILEDPTVESENSFVGALIGRIDIGMVSNVHVRGDKAEVVSEVNHVGGLVGWASSEATITSSSSSAQVEGNNNVGGLVGYNFSTVTGYATGAVSGGASVGGLVGVNRSTVGTVVTVTGYATGTVSGNNSVGGLVGRNEGTTVTGYALGYVIKKYADRKSVGPGIGYHSGSGTTKVYVGRTETEANAEKTEAGKGDHVGVITTTTSVTKSNGAAPQGVVIEGKATTGSFTGFTFLTETEEGKWILGTGDNWPTLNFPSGSPAQSPSIPTKPEKFKE